jgi:hypothetical protein
MDADEAMIRLVAAVLTDYAKTMLDQLDAPRKEGVKSKRTSNKRPVRYPNNPKPVDEG